MGDSNPSKWAAFYKPMFQSDEAVRAFVEPLETLCLGDPRHTAKIMMHQTQRLISLADDFPKLRPANETLPLLFLLICSEHIAKLFKDFTQEGQSRRYVQNFFKWFLTDAQKRQLCAGIKRKDLSSLSLVETVNALYDVRCDIVHEGKYWRFHFSTGRDSMMQPERDLVVGLTLPELRCLVVQGCIKAIQDYPGGTE